ncbi:unnamed protein product [Linum trigynum]
MQGNDIWEPVNGRVVDPLPANASLNQQTRYAEEVAKTHRALTCIHAAVTEEVFTRIMTCTTAKEAWDKLQEEYQGSDRGKQMQVLNLRREFESLRMKASESIKDYLDRIMKNVNQLTLLGETFDDSRVVEKILVTVPEKFEAKISTLEDTQDLSTLSITQLINSLQATELRSSIINDDNSEEALVVRQQKAKGQTSGVKKTPRKKKKGKEEQTEKPTEKKVYPPCPICKKTNHTENYYWYRPNVHCRSCKRLGHVEKVCKNKSIREQVAVAEANEQNKQEGMFMVTCFTATSSSED